MFAEYRTYKAYVYNIVDGDTVDLLVYCVSPGKDVGFGITTQDQIVIVRLRARLIGINAPEMHGSDKEKGIAAKNHLAELINAEQGKAQLREISELNSPGIMIRTHKSKQEKDKSDSFGRYLVDLFINGVNINNKMIEDGFAVPYMVDMVR